ncbi:cell division protein FtsX [Patescibacteria group bacterium]
MIFSGVRVVKFAWQDFFRNFWLSFVTLTILILALFTINLLIIFNLVAQSAISSIEDKIDINIYFKSNINQEQVTNVQKYLQSLNGVKEVQFVSKDDAYANFKARHQDNPKILESLAEIDNNPLGASLIIKSHTPNDYQLILENLEDPQYDNLIESKDFEDHRTVISRISGITQRVNTAVIIIALVFTLIAILIIFNAIRMAIYSHREEIIAMKLVGATDWFVRGPYLLQGVIFSAVSVFITIIIIYPLLGFVQPYVSLLLETDFNLISHFNSNFLIIFGLQFLGAILINLVSSFWAVNKYLRV